MPINWNGVGGFFGRLFRPKAERSAYSSTQNGITPGTSPLDPAITGANPDPDNVYDFWKQLNAMDQDVLNRQEKLYKQRAVADIGMQTAMLASNAMAPPPPAIAGMRVTGTETNLPINLMINENRKQEEMFNSAQRGLFRSTANSSILPALNNVLVEQRRNVGGQFGKTLADFTLAQQTQANNVNNLNAEALQKATQYNAEKTYEDNKIRSQLIGQAASGITQSMVDKKAGLINVQNMRGQNLAFSHIAKKLIDSGNWELFAQIFPDWRNMMAIDIPAGNIAEAGKIYSTGE